MRTGPILCVDDEPNNLGLLRQILRHDHDLVFALTGTEALRAVARHRPALVLLDVELPDLDGYQVCRLLKTEPASRDTPVIFVTNLAGVGDEQAGFAAGGVDYITKPVSPAIVRARVATHLSLVRAAILEDSYRDAIFMLGKAGHYSDEDTGVHIWRMAAYARVLAEAMDWPAARCDLLEMAAPMHDTGKIGIPDAILKKPGPLTVAEWAVMKTHSRIGHEILSQSEAPVFALAAEIALNHHERWDGSGYPQGRAGREIPESARVVAVADVFDALSMKRPYKDAWPLERVLTTLQEAAGSHLDAQVVDRFMGLLPTILKLKALWDARERPTDRTAPAAAPCVALGAG